MATRRPTPAWMLEQRATVAAVGRGRPRARLAFLVAVAAYGAARLASADWWDLLDDLNLAVHEAGHVVFMPFGETMMVLGGSLFQVIVPAAFVAYFIRSRQRYAAAVTTVWVAQSLLNVARYIADARAQELPLLGGEDSIHDWWLLLTEHDLIASDTAIAGWVRLVAGGMMLAAIGVGWMATRNGDRSQVRSGR